MTAMVKFFRNKISGLRERFEFWRMPFIYECRVRDATVLLHVETKKELKRAKNYSSKEPNTLNWLDNFIKQDDVLFDIGANIGQYSLYPAQRLSGKCRVYAFEPEALNFAKLNINIRLNSLSECVRGYPIALSGRDKVENLYIKEFGYGQAMHTLEAADEPGHIQGTLSLSLDSLVFKFGLPVPNHLKIDVDGLEKEIVEGGHRVLGNTKVQTILIEANSNRDWFIDHFSKYGFEKLDYSDNRNLIFKRK